MPLKKEIDCVVPFAFVMLQMCAPLFWKRMGFTVGNI